MQIPFLKWKRAISLQLHMQWTTAFPSYCMKFFPFSSSYIVLIHGAELLDPNRPWLFKLKSAILSKADAVIAGSRHTAAILVEQGIACKRLEVIPYGNPLEGNGSFGIKSSRNLQVNRPLQLLCMHRLVPRKGTKLLLIALAELKDFSWNLDLIGEGEEKSELINLVKDMGLADRIKFHPPLDEELKIKLMQQADLFILPSLPPNNNNHFEGLGLTLLEAQSLGLPVLGARTGGIPEAIAEGKTGILFAAGDAKDLKEKLGQIFLNPEILNPFREAGPAWVENNFSWKIGLARLAEVIREVSDR